MSTWGRPYASSSRPPEQNVLIDAGDVGGGDAVTAYLKAQGVERIDLLIATILTPTTSAAWRTW